MVNQNHQPQLSDIEKLPNICCKHCGGRYFKSLIVLKHLSRILSKDGQDNIIPMQVLVCDKCGKELDDQSIEISDNKNISEIIV